MLVRSGGVLSGGWMLITLPLKLAMLLVGAATASPEQWAIQSSPGQGQVARQVGKAVWLRTDRMARSDRPAVDWVPGRTLMERLGLLARCGLAEAMVMATPARRLSGGQLYRLALANAISLKNSALLGTVVIVVGAALLAAGLVGVG